MTSLYVHPRLGEVTLSQTVRARRISISVRATGAVRLSFPCGAVSYTHLTLPTRCSV